MRTTASPVYVTAKNAQHDLHHTLNASRNPADLTAPVRSFEDTMNGLSGELQNLEPEYQLEIQTENAALIELGTTKGVSIRLHDSVLPKADRSDFLSSVVKTAKRLYPRTESVTIQSSNEADGTELVNAVANNTTSSVVLGSATTTEEEEVEVIDSVFDEMDAEEVTETPLAADQNETVPYLSDALVELAKEAAANTEGLQAGLVVFSKNPLANLIANTRELLLYYTAGNYANLNTTLSAVSTDINLTAEYKALREAIGGGDGLSGCVSQLDNFKDHTDRLSGLVLDSGSSEAEPDDNSTTENLTLYGLTGGPTVIFSFDARKFRSAKYMIQATAEATDRGHQATELYILHDNHHAYTREIAAIYSENPFVSYTTRLLNNRVEVLATTTAANTDFVIHGTRLQIARASRSYSDMSQQVIIENHELLAVYLNDGVDYVALQSASLLKPSLVANLAREFRDMLAILNSANWVIQGTAAKQASLLSLANTLSTRRAEIQTAIDTDYDNFLAIRKLTESLDIAYNLTVAYTDNNGNAIPKVTLNNATIQAIESELE